MDVKEFFRKAKEICDRNGADCLKCPIFRYCCDGVFSSDEHEVAEIVAAVENAED